MYAACDTRVYPRIVLSVHAMRNAAWSDMNKRMRKDPSLPGNVAKCPKGKRAGDTLVLAEILSDAENP